ncbi:MAG TPA: hypothetical protein VGN01_19130 [Acidobacteriaceae bacterium]|jgi:hypothetical protein
MTRLLSIALLLPFAIHPGLIAQAQVEGPVPTQVLVNVDPKSTPPANASDVIVQVNDHKEPLTAWKQVVPANAQVAVVMDDGLRQSVGREVENLRKFIRTLPPGVEVMVGFMEYGHVTADLPFTTDHDAAAATLHIPQGVAGMSASPYLCLSDFVKHWPSSNAASSAVSLGATSQHKARFILMLSNGVDPYNGSTSVMNQGSPYVDAAVKDAQRAGVAVYAIYFGDAGIRGESADNSGQSYLAQLTQGTGGTNFWQGTGNPVSMAPYLDQFQHAVAETYVATFVAPAVKDPQRDMVRLKFSAAKTKLHAPELVRPGNQE